jgi:hypothetical protein
MRVFERIRGPRAQRIRQMVVGHSTYVGTMRSWDVYAQDGKAYLLPAARGRAINTALVADWFRFCGYVRRSRMI